MRGRPFFQAPLPLKAERSQTGGQLGNPVPRRMLWLRGQETACSDAERVNTAASSTWPTSTTAAQCGRPSVAGRALA